MEIGWENVASSYGPIKRYESGLNVLLRAEQCQYTQKKMIKTFTFIFTKKVLNMLEDHV